MKKFTIFANSKLSAIILNILLPGAGHVYFREYVFGIFVLLIWLIAAALFHLSFILDLNNWAKMVIFGLPLVFYFFTFFDLLASIKKKKDFTRRGLKFAVIIYAISMIYQIASPTAPFNFMISNGPDLFVLNDNRLSPIYSRGTLMKASRLAYKASIVGFKGPVFHHFPERYDIVRFRSENGTIDNAVVLGLPQEEIELIEGTLIINGLPDFEGWIGGVSFSGSWPAVIVGDGKVLAATLKLGSIDNTFQLPVSEIIGKVEPVF